MARLIKGLEIAEETAAKVLLAAAVLLVFVASLARWVGYPIVWSVDMAQLLFIWVCFFGANQALRRGQHIGVDAFVSRVPARVQRWIRIGHLVVMAAFLVPIVYQGIELAMLNVERRFSDTDMSYVWVTAAVPVGSALLLITLVRLFLLCIVGKGDGITLEGDAR